MNRILALLQLGRLHFLIGGVILNLLGIVIAIYAGAKFNLTAAVWGQIAITAIQLMTHYANDYFDLTADLHNQTPTNWSGGSRILVQEKVSPALALRIALMMAGIAFVTNLILSLFIRPGIVTFLLLLLAQTLAWFYSAPPIRLHSRGLGEITTAIIVPLLTPLTGFYLQAQCFDELLFLAVAPLCCLQFAMLLSIEFPDAEGDRQAGKATLVVRFGADTMARYYVGAIILAYIMLPLLVLMGLPPLVGVAVGLTSPLGVWLIWRGDWLFPDRWNTFAFYTIVLLMAATGAELVAFILLLGS